MRNWGTMVTKEMLMFTNDISDYELPKYKTVRLSVCLSAATSKSSQVNPGHSQPVDDPLHRPSP